MFILFSNFEHYYFSDALHSALQLSDCISLYDSEVEASTSEQFSAAFAGICYGTMWLYLLWFNVCPSLCLPSLHLILCVHFLRELPCWRDAEIAWTTWAGLELQRHLLTSSIFPYSQINSRYLFYLFLQVNQLGYAHMHLTSKNFLVTFRWGYKRKFLKK